MDQSKCLFNAEEWKDVVPVKQYDGNPPILALKYPADCRTNLHFVIR